MNKYGFKALYLGMITALPMSVAAQTPQSIAVGAFDVTPSLEIEIVEDDNLYQTGDNQVDTRITLVRPAIEAVFDNGISGVSLGYSVERAEYSERSSEDYTDKSLNFAAGTIIADNHRLQLDISKQESHDARGADSPSGGPADPDNVTTDLDEFDDDTYGFSYTVGLGLRLGLELSASEREQRYTTNRATTADFDLDESSERVGLFWDVAQAIRLGLTYTDTEIDYISDSVDARARDAEETVTSIDLSYEPSPDLTTSVRVGETERTLVASDTSATDDFWDISISWAFLSYSTISFNTTNTFEESPSTDGTFTTTRDVGVSWSHRWTDRFSTEISVTESEVTFSDSPRQDVDDQIGFSIDYQFRRWLRAGFFYEDLSRDSNTPSVEGYDQEIYGLNVLMTL